jgi:hypothetical protein
MATSGSSQRASAVAIAVCQLPIVDGDDADTGHSPQAGWNRHRHIAGCSRSAAPEWLHPRVYSAIRHHTRCRRLDRLFRAESRHFMRVNACAAVRATVGSG